MKKKKENDVFISNICRRLVIGAMSQLLVEQLEDMEAVDPVWRNKLKNVGNRFKAELDKELNLVLNVPLASEQFLKLSNIIEDEMKDIYIHIQNEVTKVVLNERDNSEQVSEEVQTNSSS